MSRGFIAIIAAALLFGLNSCGGGGKEGNSEKNAELTELDTEAGSASASRSAAQSVNPSYRSEFIDSLKRHFHVEACCNSSIAQCLAQRPDCRAAPRLAAFAEWAGNRWRADTNVTERFVASWLQSYYTTLTDDTKYASDSAGWPVVGDTASPVTVTAYYSMFCPTSKSIIFGQLFPAVTAGALRGKAKIVVKALDPIPGNRAMVAAHGMGRFMDFALEASKRRVVSDSVIYAIAESLELDRKQFTDAMESENTKRMLERSVAEARGIGVNRIPAVYISGRKYNGVPYAQWFIDAIEYAYETEVLWK